MKRYRGEPNEASEEQSEQRYTEGPITEAEFHQLKSFQSSEKRVNLGGGNTTNILAKLCKVMTKRCQVKLDGPTKHDGSVKLDTNVN